MDLDLVIQPLWNAIDQNMARPDQERENELRKEVSSLLSTIKQGSKPVSNTGVGNKKYLTNFYRIAAMLVLVFSVTFGLLKCSTVAIRNNLCRENIRERGEKT